MGLCSAADQAFGAHCFALLKDVALVIIDLYVHARHMDIILRLN
jgi:hypothetical protein